MLFMIFGNNILKSITTTMCYFMWKSLWKLILIQAEWWQDNVRIASERCNKIENMYSIIFVLSKQN